jgi:hypothetical protein
MEPFKHGCLAEFLPEAFGKKFCVYVDELGNRMDLKLNPYNR